MADILVADHQHHIHRHSRSIGGLDSGRLRATAPKIEMVANPAFSFPMKPQSSTDTQATETTSRSPSMPSTTTTTQMHKRAASALPSFSFNASDTSGRGEESTPPRTPDENAVSAFNIASQRGHRRGGSEFVGGDSRFGVSSAISSSPTKTTMPQLPSSSDNSSPAKRRTHAHRRSVAVSSHDLSQIMSSGDKSPRLSSSLPNSPLELPIATFQRSTSIPSVGLRSDLQATGQHSRDESPTRPVSRPRVEFSEEIEIIPRPLSTISSGTETSMSTVRGHSVNNSINSVLSLGSSSPASPRARGQPNQAITSIATPITKRSSVELSKRLEREGEWLKSKASESDVAKITQAVPDSALEAQSEEAVDGSNAPPTKRQKRQSLGHSFGFDRRRSEPSISVAAAESSSMSAISLQDVVTRETPRPATSYMAHERRFSGHRLKQWAMSKLHRRSRENLDSSQSLADTAEASLRPGSAESVDVPGKISIAPKETQPVAMTDLDAVFGTLGPASPPQHGPVPSRITFDKPSTYDQSAVVDEDDESPMLDLDAATEPLRTPPLSASHRRQLHSDRSSKQAASTSGFIHRRAESEPAMMTFNYNRVAACSQKSMEDVFEEDEDEEADNRLSRPWTQQEELGMGITVVDSDDSTAEGGMSSVRRHNAKDNPRPSTSYISPTPRLFVPTVDRPASLVDEVIAEEPSLVDEAVGEIEIVHAHEEPRACSLEKLSDSSEASTLLGASLPTLPLQSDMSDSTTPNTLHTSAFSSPDLLRRQGSFEASRVGTSASSLADIRTTSSCTTGEGTHDVRMSVDDVPSLTSSRSTMLSTGHGANNSRRDLTQSRQFDAIPRKLDPAQVAARRKKRASIQSLSQLMSGPFGSKTKLPDESRPQTAMIGVQEDGNGNHGGTKKRENRLKKLMFWRSRQSLREAALND